MSAHYTFGNRQTPTSSVALAVGLLFGRYAKNESSLQRLIDDAWPSLLNKKAGLSYLLNLSTAMQIQKQRLESDLFRAHSLLAKLPGILVDYEQLMQSDLETPAKIRERIYRRLQAAIAEHQGSDASTDGGSGGEEGGAASPPPTP